jgi:hypothetical protein
MTYEPTVIKKWIKSRLVGDSALASLGFDASKIFHRRARAKAALPYIIYQMQSGGADENTAGDRAAVRPLYLIKVVSTSISDESIAESALGRIEALFSNTNQTYQGLMIRCKGSGAIDYPENTPGGDDVLHEGRLWRITASSN